MALDHLSFARADYSAVGVVPEHCTWCGRGISGEFFRANGALICPVCADRAKAILPVDTRRSFLQATGVGLLASIGACLAYLLLFHFVTTTGGFGIAIGAIGVGYGIGLAMRWAVRGAGGRRYQIVAALLTYAAISVAITLGEVGAGGMPVWAYPLLALGPLANVFLGHMREGLFELFIAAIGISSAWRLLKPHALKITGPEQVQEPVTPELPGEVT
jgi:hypothetical protein